MSESGEADIKSVQIFLGFLAQSGGSIESTEDRSVLHELIRYWSSLVNEKTGEFPIVQLQPFYAPSINNRPPSQGMQGVFYGPVQNSIFYDTPVITPFERQALLKRVRKIWISGVFQPSLKGTTFIPLGLYQRTGLIENPLKEYSPGSRAARGSLTCWHQYSEVFDESEGALFILGQPGSGKTTLLLQLANTLLERANRNQTHPMPVVFNLSTWVLKRQPLAEWLVEELNTKYQMPQRKARAGSRRARFCPCSMAWTKLRRPSWSLYWCDQCLFATASPGSADY